MDQQVATVAGLAGKDLSYDNLDQKSLALSKVISSGEVKLEDFAVCFKLLLGVIDSKASHTEALVSGITHNMFGGKVVNGVH
jgi:hypothetical protein